MIQVRVRVEHTFAALKGRFQSLRELRHPVTAEKDLHYSSYWILCCFILHNMIIRFEGRHEGEDTFEWARREGARFVAAVGDGTGENAADGTPGQQRRLELVDFLLDSPYSVNAVHRD